VVFGEQHLNHLCAEYLAYYHEERPHQSLDNESLNQPAKRGRPKTKRGKIDDEIVLLSEVRCLQRLGGLLKSYSRAAA
jgi:putative transposase